MTEPIVSWAVGFLTGGFFGFRLGWLWGRGGAVRRTPFIFNEGHATRTNSGPGPTTPKPDIVPKPQPPSGPPQPLAADLIRYSRWRDEQIRRALTEPIHFDEGRVQRGNSDGGPTTPKPEIVPGFYGPRRTVRWFINNPVQIAECGGPCTIGPSHCDCGALWVDVSTTNQPPEAP